MKHTLNDITKTVYSIGWNKTVSALDEYRKKDVSDLFNETWTKKQDGLHIEYLNLWKSANDKNLIWNDSLKLGYPTNGSSEAIFMQLTYLNSIGKRLVVFNEEYEGYTMFAKNISMPILFVERENIDWSLINSEKDVFFISQPSSIDGNMWIGFDDFITETAKRNIQVYIDLAYVGLFEHNKVNLNSHNIAGVFFSLSKLFGVYYHRIGGCFLREENPLLWPMLWFKNLNSMEYGNSLLNLYKNGAYDSTFLEIKEKQISICRELSDEWNLEIVPSDVPMIATIKFNPTVDWLMGMKRSDNPKNIRICISKILELSLK